MNWRMQLILSVFIFFCIHLILGEGNKEDYLVTEILLFDDFEDGDGFYQLRGDYSTYDDNYLGGNAGLASFRERLKNRDLLLILDYVPNQAQLREPQVVLSNSFGFGGHNGCLIFRQWEEGE